MHPGLKNSLMCLSSFCRKITLVRHQNRLHPQGKVAPASSEDDKMGQLHQVLDNTSLSYDQCLLPQDPYYEQAATPNLEFKIQQNLQLAYNVAQGILLPIEFWNIPAMAPFYMQHTQQLYLQPMQQQYSQSYPNHTPPDLSQPSSASYAMAERYWTLFHITLISHIHISIQDWPEKQIAGCAWNIGPLYRHLVIRGTKWNLP